VYRKETQSFIEKQNEDLKIIKAFDATRYLEQFKKIKHILEYGLKHQNNQLIDISTNILLKHFNKLDISRVLGLNNGFYSESESIGTVLCLYSDLPQLRTKLIELEGHTGQFDVKNRATHIDFIFSNRSTGLSAEEKDKISSILGMRDEFQKDRVNLDYLVRSTLRLDHVITNKNDLYISLNKNQEKFHHIIKIQHQLLDMFPENFGDVYSQLSKVLYMSSAVYYYESSLKKFIDNIINQADFEESSRELIKSYEDYLHYKYELSGYINFIIEHSDELIQTNCYELDDNGDVILY
jgi:hypothetical protein